MQCTLTQRIAADDGRHGAALCKQPLHQHPQRIRWPHIHERLGRLAIRSRACSNTICLLFNQIFAF